MKVTLRICIDIVRIKLIAADDHVAQGFDCVVCDNSNIFQSDRSGKSDRRACDVLDNGGSVPTPLGPGIPAWAKAATNEAVRKRAYASGLQEDGVKQGTIRARYFRARLQLQDRGFIRIESEDILIWLGKPVAR